MPLFIVAIFLVYELILIAICKPKYSLITLVIRWANVTDAKQKADWFFNEAFTTPDPVLKVMAFQQAMCYAGEKDSVIVCQVFEDLLESNLI